MNLNFLVDAVAGNIAEPNNSNRWTYRTVRPVGEDENASRVVADLRQKLGCLLQKEHYSLQSTLQVNIDARRIVASCRDQDGNVAVVKWTDTSEIGTYAYSKSNESSRQAHFIVALDVPGLIPRGILLKDELLIVEKVHGHRFLEKWYANQDMQINYVRSVFSGMQQNFKHLAKTAKTFEARNASILSERLAWLTSYGLHVKAATGTVGIAHALCISKKAQSRHGDLVSEFVREARKSHDTLIPIWSSRDLNELNIHLDGQCATTVDWDNSGLTFYSLEIAMFTSRVIALAVTQGDTQLATTILHLARESVKSCAPQEMGLFCAALGLHLMHLQINPWMWPNQSSFRLRKVSVAKRVNELMALRRWAREALF